MTLSRLRGRRLGRRSGRLLAATTASLAVVVSFGGATPATAHGGDRPAYTLTVLHHNDGESQLVHAPGNPDFGGVARFRTLVDDLRRDATTGRPPAGQARHRGVVLLSSGDNFLPGPEFNASLDKGVPFYDSLALRTFGYDAMTIGNHEFDFGPDVLADFIDGFGAAPPPLISANLDVSHEPRLAALADDGTIVASTTTRERGERIGIVGATTPALPSISSPRNVKVLDDVAGLVQEQVDRLTARGIDKIILSSHLQGLGEDRELIPMLEGVDVAVAGGGGELLGDQNTRLVPGDELSLDPETGEPLPYPLLVTDAAGVDVPVVTTPGDYTYLGRLVVNFDRHGDVLSVDTGSGLVRVSGVTPDAVAPDPHLQQTVVDPVVDYTDDLADTVLADSEVALDGRRQGVRTGETNLGSLLADALLAAGRDRADEFGVAAPDVALQNGGGIRNNSVIPAGEVTELDTFDVAPFGNFVAVVPDVPRAQFKELLENAVSGAPAADGRFAQVGGFSFSYDPTRQAQQVDDEGTVLVPGQRVRSVVLDDGAVLVEDGAVVDGDPVSVATNDFSARGGDQYPFRGAPFTSVGLTYQQALADYLTDQLGGQITAADYPEGGSGRIVLR